MIEVPLRFRCDECGTALEFPRMVAQIQFPVMFGLLPPVDQLPHGWTIDADRQRIYCPPHQRRMVQPVSGLRVVQ